MQDSWFVLFIFDYKFYEDRRSSEGSDPGPIWIGELATWSDIEAAHANIRFLGTMGKFAQCDNRL